MKDFTSRGNLPHFARAKAHKAFPAWVGQVPSATDFVKMSSEAFADKASRTLPICNATATFYSALDVFHNADIYPEAALDRVKQACEMFGIGGDVAPYADLFADEFEKSAATIEPGAFAINTMIGDKDIQLLPIGDVEDIRKSASDLMTMVEESRIFYPMARQAAVTIVKAARELGVAANEMPASLIELGTERLPTPVTPEAIGAMQQCLRKRAGYSTVPSYTEESLAGRYNDDLNAYADGEITAAEFTEKIAAADFLAGVHGAYRFSGPRRIELPHEIVFSGPSLDDVEKLAKTNVVINDITVPLAAFRALDPVESAHKLSKRAGAAIPTILEASDARDVTLEIANWESGDVRTLCRMLVARN